MDQGGRVLPFDIACGGDLVSDQLEKLAACKKIEAALLMAIGIHGEPYGNIECGVIPEFRLALAAVYVLRVAVEKLARVEAAARDVATLCDCHSGGAHGVACGCIRCAKTAVLRAAMDGE